MNNYDKLEQIATHKISWYTRTFSLLMKRYGLSELFLLPIKSYDKLAQFCCSKIFLVIWNYLATHASNEIQELFCYL